MRRRSASALGLRIPTHAEQPVASVARLGHRGAFHGLDVDGDERLQDLPALVGRHSRHHLVDFLGRTQVDKGGRGLRRAPGRHAQSLRRASSSFAGPFCVPFHCSIFSALTLSQAATATSPEAASTSKGRMARDVIHPPIFGSSCLRNQPYPLWPKPTRTG